jgi:ABC-type branched-subunit amino acid transport system permease subunit
MTAEQITIALTWLLSTGFPLLVGLVTTKETNPLLKVLILATISFAAGIISQVILGLTGEHPFNLASALLAGLGAWVTAVLTHREVWTRTNLIDALAQIGVKPKAKHAA